MSIPAILFSLVPVLFGLQTPVSSRDLKASSQDSSWGPSFGSRQDFVDQELSPQQDPWDPSFTLQPDPNKLFIFLIASFRSGSTFLGQLFATNPDVLYLFEPIHDGT